MIGKIRSALSEWFDVSEESQGSRLRYTKLRRNMFLLMIIVTIVPLAIMAVINYHQYQSSLKRETLEQLHSLVNKTKHSMELFLQERLSAIQYIAHAYSYEELRKPERLREVFYTMQENFSGFVDLGLINPQGVQVNYVGPYNLEGKDYSQHESYQEVRIKGNYISDVFLG